VTSRGVAIGLPNLDVMPAKAGTHGTSPSRDDSRRVRNAVAEMPSRGVAIVLPNLDVMPAKAGTYDTSPPHDDSKRMRVCEGQSPMRSGSWNSRARLPKRVNCASKANCTVPVGPWRCLPMITSPLP